MPKVQVDDSQKADLNWRSPITIALLLACIKVVIFILAGGSYGYFRDELYFLACSEHLAMGYPDHAPLSVFLTKFSRDIFGDSLHAIRLLPAVSGVLKIVVTGLIVRELGGRHLAMLLSCMGVLVAPVYLATDNLLAMNSYEPLFWMGCVLSYIWAVKREDPRYWLLFGSFAGLGMMNKHSMLFFGIAFVVGLLATQDRKYLLEKYLWLGGLFAFLIFLPNLIWQYENNWATLELLRTVQSTGKNVVLLPHEFIWQQIFILLPITAPLWLGGLWYLLIDKSGIRFRTIGIAYIAVLVIMIGLKAKNYYLAPVYPVLFAAGGVFWERMTESSKTVRSIAIGYAGLLLIGGALLAPLAVPILPVEKYIAYQNSIGIAPPKTEVGHQGPLPQHYGDMFGWEEMTAKTAAVYYSLPVAERERAAIFGDNYGEAGAIDFFGRQYGLPKSISPHQSYFLWGPRGYDGSVMILLGSDKKDAEEQCGSVEERDPVSHPYAMEYERFNILICRDLKRPLGDIWRDLKHWN